MYTDRTELRKTYTIPEKKDKTKKDNKIGDAIERLAKADLFEDRSSVTVILPHVENQKKTNSEIPELVKKNKLILSIAAAIAAIGGLISQILKLFGK